MSGSNGGRYILCDICEKTTFSLNLPWPRDGDTLAAARKAGWETRLRHICPECRAKLQSQPALEEAHDRALVRQYVHTSLPDQRK